MSIINHKILITNHNIMLTYYIKEHNMSILTQHDIMYQCDILTWGLRFKTIPKATKIFNINLLIIIR